MRDQNVCIPPKIAGSRRNSPPAHSCRTSPGAQYREACRSRSRSEFISKIESAQQELDETDYWLEIIERCGMIKRAQTALLRQETGELARILAASAKTAKKK